ncbi:ankyrin repeat-containing domain protein [Apiospora arundinis]|uniref:Ankyrin repeat-containing domain protein n=1 Tax=Apiospora arundinis TaxID=335852 RepID=A0ABR2IIM4_9PEZI
MPILQLSNELIHEILVKAILCRGVKRGLRLRLVCKKFNELMQPALFASRLLDTYDMPRTDWLWHIPTQSGGSRLWHAYFLYRCKNETNPGMGHFCDIRRLAAQVAAEESCPETANADSILEALCWLALGKRMSSFTSTRIITADSFSTSASLLSAAAHFNMVALAERLLHEGASPADEEHIFPPAIQVAAMAGHGAMLELFQRNLPQEPFAKATARTRSEQAAWDTRTGTSSIEGAAIRGDLELLKLALRPFASDDDSSGGNPPADSWEETTNPWQVVQFAQWNSTSPETFDYLQSWLPGTLPGNDTDSQLARYAELGRVDMVRHLVIQVGVSVDGGLWDTGRHDNPLANACRHGHEEVVDFLLSRGAIIDNSEEDDRDSALPAAAAGGSLALVRKLIDHGAPLDTIPALQAIREAIMLEHTEMLQLLLERCDFPHPSEDYHQHIRGPYTQSARSEGLDSMVEILEAWSEANPPVEEYVTE